MKTDVSKYLTLRRDIHRHPELSNHEVETTRRIREFLALDGLELRPIGGLNGGFVNVNTGMEKTLCMRADIDALPLHEETGVSFASENNGVMHACGHDMHTAIAAAIACELHKVRELLKCNIVVLFQPAEENNPDGGAKPVVEAGFLEDQHVDEVYGLHMWPQLPVGDIEVCPGPIMAASDRFNIRIAGRTAHAAEPHLGVDAIAIGMDIYCALVQKLRREVSPCDSMTISIGSFKTSGRYNIICPEAVLEGTIRTTSDGTRAFLPKRIAELSSTIASSHGGSAEANVNRGYGIVLNDVDLFRRFSTCAVKTLGPEHVHTNISPSLIAEDFYYYGKRVPSLYFHLGCQSKYSLHSNHFLPQEEALTVAVDLMTDYFLSQ